jgi:hypothetical protein
MSIYGDNSLEYDYTSLDLEEYYHHNGCRIEGPSEFDYLGKTHRPNLVSIMPTEAPPTSHLDMSGKLSMILWTFFQPLIDGLDMIFIA